MDIFSALKRENIGWGNFEKGGTVFYRSGLIRNQVKEDALERLSNHPGAKRKTLPFDKYDTLKHELLDKECALAKQAVELAILKKANGDSCKR